MKCRAYQASDQMLCPCGLAWDVNDPDPPRCRALDQETITLHGGPANGMQITVERGMVQIEVSPKPAVPIVARENKAIPAGLSLDRFIYIRSIRDGSNFVYQP